MPPTVSDKQIFEYNFVQDRPALLNCLVSGFPIPDIIWIRQGVPISASEKYQIFESNI